MREGEKKEEVGLPEEEEKVAAERTQTHLHLHQPLLMPDLPALEAVAKRLREVRQAGQALLEEKARQGGWKRQAEPALAVLFQAPVCDLPQAGGWALTLLTLTSLAVVPSWGWCLVWRIPE